MINPENPNYSSIPVSNQRPAFDYIIKDLKEPPILSIVTPFYNTGEIFHETAKSVLNQSLQQWEWLIINDGSTDKNAINILGHYQTLDPRIRVINHPKNSGLSAARNTGFNNARTDYILILDSDDLLEPTAAEKWFWFLNSYPEYAFVKGLNVGFGAKEYIWKKGFHLGSEILKYNTVNPTSMIRKQVHQNVGGFDESFHHGLEDWDFWLNCADSGYWGGTVFEFLDWYRNRQNHSDRWSSLNKSGIKQFLKNLSHRYPNLTEKTFPKIHLNFPGEFANTSRDLPCNNHLVKRKPRLLMLIPWLKVGGADQFNYNLIQNLSNSGWEVTIAATLGHKHPWHSKFSSLTPDIFILPHFLRLIDYPRFLHYLISSRNPDVVLVTNSEYGYFSLPYLRTQFPHITFMDYNHIEEINWKNGSHPRTGIEYQYWLDGNIVASQHLKEWMVSRGAKEEAIDVCYINVDTDHFKPNKDVRINIRALLDIDDKTPVLIYIGRILEQKQPKVFAETVKELQHSGCDFRVLVIGDGPDLPWLRSFIHKYNLEKTVLVLGEIPNKEVKDYLNAADILFLPSKWEGIALTIYEAMACGLPVVGADVGGQKELVSEDTGILIDIHNLTPMQQVQKYSVVLRNLINNTEMIASMGAAARKRVLEKFPLPKMGERMVELFEKGSARNAKGRRTKTFPREYGHAHSVLATEYTRISINLDTGYSNSDFGPVDQIVLNLRWNKFFYLTLRKVFFAFYRTFESRLKWLPNFKDWLKMRLD